MSASAPTRKPHFNHVAMSVPPDLIGGQAREDMKSFYGEVFEWAHLPMMDIDGKRLVFQTYTLEQFVFIHGEEQPMACPRMDHYGFSVGTEQELDDILGKAKAFQQRDDRVDIVDKHRDDHGQIAITACYIGYLLPMMVEIQWWEKAWEKS